RRHRPVILSGDAPPRSSGTVIQRPMLATPASSLPTGEGWTYEVKWDGYRAIAVKDGLASGSCSRNQKDLTRDYPTVVTAVAGNVAKRRLSSGDHRLLFDAIHGPNSARRPR